MFPYLFQGSDISKFRCETYELAKHTHVSFPISNKRSSHPFHLIHSDIWGLSTIPNVFGARWFVSLIDNYTRVTWFFLLKQKLMLVLLYLIYTQWFKTNLGFK